MVLSPPLHMGHPLEFAPEAALEDLGLLREGQVWRCCSCLGVLKAPRTQGLAARAAGNTVL